MMKRALLVDDDEVFCLHLVQVLGRHAKNCAVVTAGNGKDAVKILASSRIDFIITDLNMPEMNGYEFISHARANYPDMPILVVTGIKTPEVEERLRALGIARCIEKPFDPKEVAPLILSELGGILNAV
jgi:CheY-like chemotaxis protein